MGKRKKSQVFNMDPEVVATLVKCRRITTKKERNSAVLWMVEKKCREELAYALFYMTYMHPPWPKDQRARVITLCEEYKDRQTCFVDEIERQNPLAYWTDFLGRIKDEIENMC
jgi:hypothetical protein